MFEITHYNIRSERIPRSFHDYKIAHLSDLHGMVYGESNERLICAIKREAPDVVVMTGDMMDRRKGAVKRAVDLCKRIAEDYPVYYAVGNHEQTLHAPLWKEARKELLNIGVHILDNQQNLLVKGKESIEIYGLTTPMVYYKDPLGEYEKGITLRKEDIERYIGTGDKDRFQILLAHNPLYFPAYYNWGADLTMSGHIHGGIIRIPGMGGVLSPDLTLFPKYDAGHFQRKNRHLIVSRGLGNNFLFRVYNRPELVIISLKHM